MLDGFFAEVQRQADGLSGRELSVLFAMHHLQTPLPVMNPAYQAPMTSRLVQITLSTSPPAQVSLVRRIVLEIPIDAGTEDDLVLRCVEADETIESRVTEAHPAVTGTLQLRLAVFADGLLGRAIAELAVMASQALRQPEV